MEGNHYGPIFSVIPPV